MNLADRYRRAVAFDQGAANQAGAEISLDCFLGDFEGGARWENSRRAKIDEAVGELIEAANNSIYDGERLEYGQYARDQVANALARLAEVLGE